MAEIQLKRNWGGYHPGSFKSVSDSRAKRLVDLGIARYSNKQVVLFEEAGAKTKKDSAKAQKAMETRLANYKDEYAKLVKKSNKTDDDLARGTKLEELIKKAEEGIVDAD